MNRITIRDLAKMLHLSPSTVSRALSDHPDISEKTKSRVRATANQFNYSVNLHASIFRNKKSNLIALILPEINMFYIPSMINAINDLLYHTEYSLFIFISKDKLKREKKIIEQCVKWAVEGVLISPSSETKELNHLESLENAGIKTVLIDKVIKNSILPSVSIDNIGAAFSAIEHLILNGHSRIVGVFGDPEMSITRQRIEGYKKAHMEYKLNIRSEDIIVIKNSQELDSILPVIFQHNKKITAIFCMSDEILAKVYFHIYKAGKKVYHDISLIAISDGTYPYLTFPRTTFIKDSGQKLGKKACELIINEISDKNFNKNVELKLNTKLVRLDSIKNIN